MSLTSHLANRESVVRQFFFEQFPNTRSVTRECARILAGASTIRPNTTVPYGTLGTAIDYRIRYYFSITPSKDLVAWHGAALVMDETLDGKVVIFEPGYLLPTDLITSFFASLDEVLAQLRPAGQRLDSSQEEQLARYCIVLALFEQIFRSGIHPGSPLFTGRPTLDASELLAIAEPHWVDDICSLSWLFYERMSDLLTSPSILNPTFTGSRDVGGADADFILDGCLIDIKTTIKLQVTNLWLYQLLGYVLLDYSDRYQIDKVGIYFARQGVLLKWPLSDFLNRLVGGLAPPLEELRGRFRRMVESSAGKG